MGFVTVTEKCVLSRHKDICFCLRKYDMGFVTWFLSL